MKLDEIVPNFVCNFELHCSMWRKEKERNKDITGAVVSGPEFEMNMGS